MSWYKNSEPYTEKEESYFALLESVFSVPDAAKTIVPYKLQPHQKEWHKYDVNLIKRELNRIVVKSRNTSFTTSMLISCLAAVPNYPSQVVPFVRLNETRAIDLITDCKKLIRNIKPLSLPTGIWPFDPEKVVMKSKESIFFPNGVEFRAFPANSQAAEVIRGLRIAGCAGGMDESNFMKDYENIYISLRDAASGSVKGDKIFQMNIGTTLKGRTTPFHLWYDKMEAMGLPNFKIFKWPVFDPLQFNVKLPITEQDLDPIVPWHSVRDLENKRIENEKRFMEEYMCTTSDSDTAFYPYELVMKCMSSAEEFSKEQRPKGEGIYFMGVDPASVNDYFAISIFEKIDDTFYQRFVTYKRDVLLPDMQDFCEKLIMRWHPLRVRVDANGIGLQLAQYLQKRFGAVINPIKGLKIKGLDKLSRVNMSEFMHTNHKTLMSYGKVILMSEEMQISHYSMWEETREGKISAERSEELGHGDIVIANCLSTLPLNYKARKSLVPTTIGGRIDIWDKPMKEDSEEEDVNWG